MKRFLIVMVALVTMAGLMTTGCSQAAPPAPTQAPAAPKAAEPTKAAAPAATTQAAAPAKKVDFPTKGKAITLIMPFSAGGGADTRVRMVAPLMEKVLGTPVEVSAKPGAGSQIGLQELATAKPDGYTLGMTNNPTTLGVYLTPDRQATFNRKSFEPVAMFGYNAEVIVVKADSPYKTLKDLLDAVKAKPRIITASSNGFMSNDHVAVLQLGQMIGADFAVVNFDGASEAMVSLLGGKIDCVFGGIGTTLPQVKSGEARILAILDKQGSKVLPDVPTMESLGYKLYMGSDYALSAPAGTPKEIVEILSAAVKTATEDADLKQKFEAASSEVRYMNPTDYGKYWDQMETDVKPIVELALKQK